MATATATACEPSHCLSMVCLRLQFLSLDDLISLAGGVNIALRDGTLELLSNCGLYCVQRNEPAHRRKRTQQGHIGYGSPHVFHRQFGRPYRQQMVRPEVFDELAQPQLFERAGGIDQDVAVFFQTTENIHLVPVSYTH